MPRATDPRSLVHAAVTPRFEVFYALQALETGSGEHLHDWRRQMERKLPARLRTSLASVAPAPLIWPLLADALRESPPDIAFPDMLDALRRMDERTFQTFVLGGAFKAQGAVNRLVSSGASLSRIVGAESKTGEKLLNALGLFPFKKSAPSVLTFERIVRAPGAYRDEVVGVLADFWASGFRETWQQLEPGMRDAASELRTRIMRGSLSELAAERRLPVTTENGAIVVTRGGTRTEVATTAIYLVPSVFNTSRLWAAYADARGRTRFYLPLLDPDLLPTASTEVNSVLVFRALGDTTRYAIASSIARAPMTSVELARAFEVSKPTITHHVQLLRAAGLIEEVHTSSGVRLSLNRRILERLSSAVTREMFSDKTSPVVRRSRRPAG